MMWRAARDTKSRAQIRNGGRIGDAESSWYQGHYVYDKTI